MNVKKMWLSKIIFLLFCLTVTAKCYSQPVTPTIADSVIQTADQQERWLAYLRNAAQEEKIQIVTKRWLLDSEQQTEHGKMIVNYAPLIVINGVPLNICDGAKKKEIAKLIAIVQEPSANFEVSVINKEFGGHGKNGVVVLSSKNKKSQKEISDLVDKKVEKPWWKLW